MRCPLSQIVKVHDGLEEYTVGGVSTNKTLEVNNFGRTEVLPISTVSNQEFSPEECARLAEATLQWNVYPKMTKVVDTATVESTMKAPN